MPVIETIQLPIFLKNRVIKRKGLLEKLSPDILARVPKIHSRELNSTWNRQFLFSGQLESCRQGISCLTFLPDKNPIIFFFQNWKEFEMDIKKMSHGEHYLENLASRDFSWSYSKSIKFTCTLEQFFKAVQMPGIPIELKNLAKQFIAYDLKPKTPTQVLRQEFAQAVEEVEKKIEKKISVKLKHEYISKMKKANKMRDPQEFKEELFEEFRDTALKSLGIQQFYIKGKKSLRLVKKIKGQNFAIKKVAVKAIKKNKEASKIYTAKKQLKKKEIKIKL